MMSLRPSVTWHLYGLLGLLASSLSSNVAVGAPRGNRVPSVAPLSVRSLMDAFSKMPGLEARFVEEKKISLLAKPLVSRGRLYFTRPGLLRRTVESPRPSSVIVTPTAVHMRTPDEHKSIALDRMKDVEALVQSLVWLLAGNHQALKNVYRVRMMKTANGWRLELTPKGPPLSKLISSLRVTGRGLVVEKIRVIETSGDESVTRIVSANPNRRFSRQERRQLFDPTGQ